MLPLLGIALNLVPTLAQWIGGDKAGNIATQVTEAAKAVFGTSDEGAIEKAIATDPNLALQFKLAIANIEDRERQRAHDELIARMRDTQSARDRDKAIQVAGHRNWRADILAILACGSLVLCVWLIAANMDLPERATNAIMFVAGVFASAVRDVYNFEFGSSRQSKDKDTTIANLTK